MCDVQVFNGTSQARFGLRFDAPFSVVFEWYYNHEKLLLYVCMFLNMRGMGCGVMCTHCPHIGVQSTG